MNELQAQIARVTDPAGYGPVAQERATPPSSPTRPFAFVAKRKSTAPSSHAAFLSVVHFAGQPTIAAGHSGRLELAEWLTSPKNPLTSRVIVNRVWHHLFGSGLVKTVDNFGINGDVPSHPELLDHLANRLIRDGWSIKKLVRSIMLTRAYRLSASTPAEPESIDPDNRLVWRHTPRRLDAEEIRDATLAVAGQLDLSRPVGSPAMQLPVIELANNGPPAQRMAAAAAASRHRSVYLPLLRGLTPNSLAAFDFAEQGMVTGARDTTTVAPQALYLLNDPFVRTESQALAGAVARSHATRRRRADRSGLSSRLRSSGPRNRNRAGGRLPRGLRGRGQRRTGRLSKLDSRRQGRADQGGSLQDQPVQVCPAGDPQSEPNGGSFEQVDRRSAPAVEYRTVARRTVERGPSVGIVLRSAQAAWQSFCQALLSAAEFRYVR